MLLCSQSRFGYGHLTNRSGVWMFRWMNWGSSVIKQEMLWRKSKKNWLKKGIVCRGSKNIVQRILPSQSKQWAIIYQIANQVTDRLSKWLWSLGFAFFRIGVNFKVQLIQPGKGLFTEIIIGHQETTKAVGDIQGRLASYKSADSEVAGYGRLDLRSRRGTAENKK